MNAFSMREMFGLVNTRIIDVKSKNMCCGKEMILDISKEFYRCLNCNKLSNYKEYLHTKVENQHTRIDAEGNYHYGKSVEKTDEDKIGDIVVEFSRKIKVNMKFNLEEKVLSKAAKIFYTIVKQRIKKKDNRDQLFAACLFLTSIDANYVLSPEELIDLLNLRVRGISTGLTLIAKFKAHNDLDIDICPRYEKGIFSYMFNRLDEGRDFNFINVDKYIKFAYTLYEELLDKNIIYNAKVKTKCAGITYYIIRKFDLFSDSEKNISNKIGITQSIMKKSYKTIASDEAQELLPEELRI